MIKGVSSVLLAACLLFAAGSPWASVSSAAYTVSAGESDLRRADDIIEELEIMQEEEEEYFLDMEVEISRLEIYRSNPLDLNTALHAQLLDLPGIGDELAAAIRARRREMRKFQSVEDIRDLLGPDRFESVSPFVTVLDETDIVQFHGDIRISAETQHPYHSYYFNIDPEYQNPLQIAARHRLRYGNRLEFGFQMSRKASAHWPPLYDGALNVNYANFNDYFLGTRYLLLRSAGPLDTLVLGSYRLDYFRPLTRTRRLRGLRIDERAAINAGFYGAAAETRVGEWELTAFVSDKEFAVGNINEFDGSVGDHPRSFYYTGNYPIFEPPYLRERIYGGIVRRHVYGGLVLGAGWYQKSFDRVLDHENDFRSFRGDRINILDIEAEYTHRNIRFLLDWGLSRYRTFDAVYDSSGARDWSAGRDWFWDSGNALRLTVTSHHGKAQLWAYYWRVDHDYFDLLGEGYESTYNGRNETRYSIGGRIEPKRGMYSQAEVIYQELLKLYDGAPRTGRFLVKLRQSWDITPKLLTRYTGTFSESDEWRTTAVRYSPMQDAAHRLEVIHRASDRIRLRGVFRVKRQIFDEIGYIADYDTESGNYGELRYRAGPLIILSRISVQESGYGTGWRIRPEFVFSRHARIKMEYEQEPAADGAAKNIFKIQYDMAW